MKDQLLNWLRKLAAYLKMTGAALTALAAAIDTLVAILGPGFGFGTA